MDMIDTEINFLCSDARRNVRRRSYSSSGSSRSPSVDKKKPAIKTEHSPSPPPTHRKDAKPAAEAPAKRAGRSSSEESGKGRAKSPSVTKGIKQEPDSPKYHKADKAQKRAYRTKR